ncbi:hypothetical protein BFP71_14265 [Roseivirga misakiensis]|uniref:Uncharacterized protein n=2 Tax=Roseivirga misakiensis TaxID=1563681 RepID=A0A1E5SZY6_9BACT|nr:hypothetical protein BFP71_14265 [Roseivirga misakiensis]
MAQQKPKNQWTYSVGLGMAIIPSYLGDDESRILLFPNFTATDGNKFFFSLLEGASYHLINTNTWRMGPVLKSDIGRFEDGSLPSSITNKTDDLIGFGDIDATIEPGVFIEYTKKSIATKLELRQGVGGHKGIIGELKSEYRGTLKSKLKSIYYSIGPELRFAGSNFNNTFFGINQEQSSNTDLAVFESESGLLSYGISGSIIFPINEKLSAITFLRYNRLGNVASDSHLIRQYGSSTQKTLVFMINYQL